MDGQEVYAYTSNINPPKSGTSVNVGNRGGHVWGIPEQGEDGKEVYADPRCPDLALFPDFHKATPVHPYIRPFKTSLGTKVD